VGRIRGQSLWHPAPSRWRMHLAAGPQPCCWEIELEGWPVRCGAVPPGISAADQEPPSFANLEAAQSAARGHRQRRGHRAPAPAGPPGASAEAEFDAVLVNGRSGPGPGPNSSQARPGHKLKWALRSQKKRPKERGSKGKDGGQVPARNCWPRQEPESRPLVKKTIKSRKTQPRCSYEERFLQAKA